LKCNAITKLTEIINVALEVMV